MGMSITLNNMSHATIHTYTPQCVHANYVYVYIHTHADPHHPAHMHIKRTCIKLLFFSNLPQICSWMTISHWSSQSYTMLPFKLIHHLICKRAQCKVTRCHSWTNKIVCGWKDVRKQEKKKKKSSWITQKMLCVWSSLDAANILYFSRKEIRKYDTKETHEHKNRNLFSRWLLWLKLRKFASPRTFGISGFKQEFVWFSGRRLVHYCFRLIPSLTYWLE